MNWRLVIRSQARADIKHAAVWYGQQRSMLGEAFLEEIELTLARIVARPMSFPIGYKTARRGLTRRFPYKIFFVTSDDLISVIAVLHSRQSEIQISARLRRQTPPDSTG